MSTVFNILATILMVAVILVLTRGLWNLMQGGNPNKSNKLMQLRVLLQLIAVVVIVVTIWLARGGH